MPFCYKRISPLDVPYVRLRVRFTHSVPFFLFPPIGNVQNARNAKRRKNIKKQIKLKRCLILKSTFFRILCSSQKCMPFCYKRISPLDVPYVRLRVRFTHSVPFFLFPPIGNVQNARNAKRRKNIKKQIKLKRCLILKSTFFRILCSSQKCMPFCYKRISPLDVPYVRLRVRFTHSVPFFLFPR